MTEIEWNDSFNLDVEEIDTAHKKLFSIVNKLIALTQNPVKQQHACREGVKYFKGYTLKHFAEEEAYMQAIAYAGLPMHKSLHDNLRDKTLPALEQELEAQDYSVESVQHFIGICVGWLTGHIMVEDRAIAGKAASKWVYKPSEDKMDSIIKAAAQGLKSLCRSQVQLVSQHYDGKTLSSGTLVCYRLGYCSPSGQKQQIYLAYEESVVIHTLNDILNMNIQAADKTVIEAMKMLSVQLVDFINKHFPGKAEYSLEQSAIITSSQFARLFSEQCPACSLLLNVEDKGYVIMCIDTFSAA